MKLNHAHWVPLQPMWRAKDNKIYKYNTQRSNTKRFWSYAPDRSSAPKESRWRLSFCIRGERCFLSILKTGAGGPTVQLGSSFLAALYQAVTYLDLRTSFVKSRAQWLPDRIGENESYCETWNISEWTNLTRNPVLRERGTFLSG